jgi:uncharacterized FlaG/YvyC family protein
MEALVSALQSGRQDLRPASRVESRPRVDEPSQASRQREEHVEHAGVDQTKAQPAPKPVERAAERLNAALQEFQRDLSISVHQDTGQMVVKVTDLEGNVIRQIPPEQLLEAEINIDKIVGLFVNDQV